MIARTPPMAGLFSYGVCLMLVAANLYAQPPQLPKLEFRTWSGDINVPDPVAVSVDSQGRVFATQTVRRKIQDLDIREHRQWIPTDVGLKTIDEKRAFFHSALKIGGDQALQRTLVEDVNQDGEYDWRDLTVLSEVIYRLVDEDQDGRADTMTVFADDFKTEVTGIAAGVMAHDGDVYATVAPDLWKLRDEDQDGTADSQVSIAHGFGLHIAYGGHDMHGLTVGPDGKIYWSIGDKGINVTTPEGKIFAYPNQGGVMRCNPDGSDFEVFAHGLRNVQEIAFDQYGNLFGVDNDSDQTDERERFVYIVNEMDAGWRNNYQYRGGLYNPWTAERLWEAAGPEHPAYIIPPISYYVDGPAGFKFNPGTALSSSYQNYFFLTSAPNGYQYAFQVEPDGDSYKMIHDHQIGSGRAIVGFAFGPDGGLYGADWDGGYPLDQKGSVVRIDVPQAEAHPLRGEVQSLLREGFAAREKLELVAFLGHEDMRVRLGAQFELVRRNDAYSLAGVARDATAYNVARLHGIWGLGQIGRTGDLFARDTLGLLLSDKDKYVRGQAAKTLGELKQAYGSTLIRLLADEEPYVRTLAGLAIARHATRDAVKELLTQAEKLQPQQHYLRHALVTALSRCADADALAAEKGHDNELRRMCCALALRRQASPKVAEFLQDKSSWIATEAARAIHDDWSIPEALPRLAESLSTRKQQSLAYCLRAINANYRIGDAEAAERVVQFAVDESRTESERLAAIDALAAWLEPPPLDRVDGRSRELKTEDRAIDPILLGRSFNLLVASKQPTIQAQAVGAARRLGLELPMNVLHKLVVDGRAEDSLRAQALAALSTQMSSLIAKTARSGGPELQRQAVGLVGQMDRDAAFELLIGLLAGDTALPIKQACLAELGKLNSNAAIDTLLNSGQEILDGTLAPGLALDVTEALQTLTDAEATTLLAALQEQATEKWGSEKLASFAFCRDGGDAESGRDLFRNHVAAQCSRCHRTGPSGSDIGPELTKIAEKRDADYLLRAVLQPSVDIDEKYRSELFLLVSGEVLKGVVQSENDSMTVVADSSGELHEIPSEDIDDRSTVQVSLMPELTEILTPREVRDLVAYLRSLK